MNNRIKISVIIPAYNVGKYVDKTLESLKNQTFKDFEFIIINDGSTDNTFEIVNSCKSGFIQDFTVIDQENKGVSTSRNIGIERSKGTYLCFIDGDDYMELDYLELMYDKITKDKSDMVYCGYNEVHTDGSIFRKYKDIYKYTPQTLSGQELLLKYLKSETYMYIWSILFDRDTIIKNNIRFHENISYGEDQIFNYEVLNKSKIVSCVQRELINYVRHDEGTMQRLNNLKYLTILKSLYKIEKDFIKEKVDKKIINAIKYDRIVRTTVMILTNWAVLNESKKYYSLVKRKIIQNFLKRAILLNPFKYYKIMIKSLLLLYFPTMYFNAYKKKNVDFF